MINPNNREIIFDSDITAELVDFMGGDLRVVQAARVSTAADRSYDEKLTDARINGLIEFLMRDRHGVPFEHSYFTFFVRAPIFVFRELVKHRIMSMSEESARYREMRPHFYMPDENRKLVQEGKPGAYHFAKGNEQQYATVQDSYVHSCNLAYGVYKDMLDGGIAREIARGVLPVNIYSTAYITINARSMMNMLSLRRSVEGSTYPSFPQREIEMLAEDIEPAFEEKMPITHASFVKFGRVSP